VTVLSRCLQFNLKRLPIAQISERMREILEKEGVEFEAAGLRLMRRRRWKHAGRVVAAGSVDRLRGRKAGEEEARAMLGTIARDHVVRLASCWAR